MICYTAILWLSAASIKRTFFKGPLVPLTRGWLSDFTFAFHFHALEQEMATHSSVLAWRIPGTGEPGGLPSMGSHRVGHDWSDLAAAEEIINIWYFPLVFIHVYVCLCYVYANFIKLYIYIRYTVWDFTSHLTGKFFQISKYILHIL